MAEKKLPYLQAYGNITRTLQKIQTASTPDRFTHDYLKTKLNMSGGSATPVIPFLKRIGFLASDGSPTELYQQFRNPAQAGAAAAKAIKIGYAPLFEVNEYAYELDDNELKGLIVQVTGSSGSSSTVRSIVHSFKALKELGDFDASLQTSPEPSAEAIMPSVQPGRSGGLNLGYMINLNLPATSDVAVFNAIFKSLREHLISE